MKKKILSILFGLTTVLLLTACTNTATPNNSYLTSGEWAMYDRNYMFAVGVDDFDGDVFLAGNYTFHLAAGRSVAASEYDLSVAPAIFDIYIGSKVYTSVAEMKSEIPEPQLSIGGLGSSDMYIEHELLAGQYVYIIPYTDIVYEPSGYLEFKIKD